MHQPHLKSRVKLTILGALIQNIENPLTRTTPAWLRHSRSFSFAGLIEDATQQLIFAAVLRVQEQHWPPKSWTISVRGELKYDPRGVTSHVTDQRCEGKPARCRGTGKSNSLGEIGSSRDAVTYRPSAPATNKCHPRALASIGQVPRGCEILERNGKVGRTSIRNISYAQTLRSTLVLYSLK